MTDYNAKAQEASDKLGQTIASFAFSLPQDIAIPEDVAIAMTKITGGAPYGDDPAKSYYEAATLVDGFIRANGKEASTPIDLEAWANEKDSPAVNALIKQAEAKADVLKQAIEDYAPDDSVTPPPNVRTAQIALHVPPEFMMTLLGREPALHRFMSDADVSIAYLQSCPPLSQEEKDKRAAARRPAGLDAMLAALSAAMNGEGVAGETDEDDGDDEGDLDLAGVLASGDADDDEVDTEGGNHD